MWTIIHARSSCVLAVLHFSVWFLTEQGHNRLWVQNNKLTSLPPQIQQLTNLTALSISNNHMACLAPELSALTHLKDLHVESPFLKSPSPTIAVKGAKAILEYLRTVAKAYQTGTLDLGGIHLEAFPPDVGTLSALTRLKVSDNAMTELSDDIKDMVSLTHLDARRNKLEKISPEIRQLTALTELLLDKNQLTELPPSIAHCSRLRQLSLDDNPLISPPPKVIAKGIMRILEYQRRFEVAHVNGDLLDLNDLDLDEVPVEATKMENIHSLSLVGNNLEKLLIKGADLLPQMTGLTMLNISNNPCGDVIPDTVQRCRSVSNLIVANIGLKAVPAWIGILDSVKHLSLRGNKLTKLPNEMAKMHSLTSLDVGGNQMKEIPKILFGMSAMRHIMFDNNILISLEPELQKLKGTLLTLNVGKNMIEKLPDFVFDFEKLQHLDVSGNRLTQLQQSYQ